MVLKRKKKGNHLDQVCSNLSYNKVSTEEFDFTDHSGINVIFSFNKAPQDSDIRTLKTVTKETITEISTSTNHNQRNF